MVIFNFHERAEIIHKTGKLSTIQEFQKVSSTDQVKVYVSCRKKWPCREDLPCNMFEVREIQLRLPRDQTAAYTAIMDQYLTNIMLHLKKELTTGDGDV